MYFENERVYFEIEFVKWSYTCIAFEKNAFMETKDLWESHFKWICYCFNTMFKSLSALTVNAFEILKDVKPVATIKATHFYFA